MLNVRTPRVIVYNRLKCSTVARNVHTYLNYFYCFLQDNLLLFILMISSIVQIGKQLLSINCLFILFIRFKAQ